MRGCDAPATSTGSRRTGSVFPASWRRRQYIHDCNVLNRMHLWWENSFCVSRLVSKASATRNHSGFDMHASVHGADASLNTSQHVLGRTDTVQTHPNSRIGELLPHEWKRRRAADPVESPLQPSP